VGPLYDDEGISEVSSLIGEEVWRVRRIVFAVNGDPRVWERELEVTVNKRTYRFSGPVGEWRLRFDTGPWMDPQADWSGSEDRSRPGEGWQFPLGPESWEESRELIGQVIRSVRAIRFEGVVIGVDLEIGDQILGCRVVDDEFFVLLRRTGEPRPWIQWGAYPGFELPD
jgi:hypothetical protein